VKARDHADGQGITAAAVIVLVVLAIVAVGVGIYGKIARDAEPQFRAPVERCI